MITSYDLTDGQEPISHAEIDYLKKLVRSLPPDPVIGGPVILQIGAGTGIFTVTALEERPNAVIYSVDIEDCPQEFENVERAGLDKYSVHRIKANSHELGYKCPLTFHMAFIDGDHFGAGKDIEAWVKTGRVKPGGVIAFHDYMEEPPPNNPGSVYNDVNEGMAGYKRIGRVERVIAFRMRETDGEDIG